MTGVTLTELARVSRELFETSRGIFWSALPPAILLSLLMIFASGQISRDRIVGLLRRLIVAIALLA